MLASASAYSLFTVFGKNVLEELGALDVLFWRFMIAVPVAWAFIMIRHWRGGPHPLSVAWKPRFWAGVTFGAMAWLAFAGLDNLPGALYIVIIYTYPAMVAIGARLLGKTMPTQVWLAVGLTLIGIAFTVPEVISGAGGATMIGLVFTLGNALLYAGYVLFSERLVTGSGGGDGLVASAWSLTGSLAFAFMVNVFSWPIDVPNSFKGASSMVGLGVISTVVASMAFFLGVKRLGPAPAALIASTEPVLTLIWIVLFLGESLVPIQFLGAVLVITGVIWSQRAQTEIPRIQSTKA
ncbi:MAG: hypothetical protein RL119_1161 [Actinomycetota bacterium]